MTLFPSYPMPLVLLFFVLPILRSCLIATATSSGINTSPQLPPAAIDLGTTLVAIVFDQGVVVGADTRTSVGGVYVSHRSTPNKIEILDKQHMVLARSGNAATTQHLAQAARQHILTRLYSSSSSSSSSGGGGGKGAALTVAQMAHWLQNRVYGLPGHSSSEVASLLVAGCDYAAVEDNDDDSKKQNVRPSIYVILPSGACWPEDRFAVAGSGSSYILGFLDHHLQHSGSSSSSSSIKQDEAVSLCRQALSLAMARDGSSGGLCRIFVVTAQGCTEMTYPPTVATNGGKSDADKTAGAANALKGFAPSSATANRP